MFKTMQMHATKFILLQYRWEVGDTYILINKV